MAVDEGGVVVSPVLSVEVGEIGAFDRGVVDQLVMHRDSIHGDCLPQVRGLITPYEAGVLKIICAAGTNTVGVSYLSLCPPRTYNRGVFRHTLFIT